MFCPKHCLVTYLSFALIIFRTSHTLLYKVFPLLLSDHLDDAAGKQNNVIRVNLDDPNSKTDMKLIFTLLYWLYDVTESLQVYYTMHHFTPVKMY